MMDGEDFSAARKRHQGGVDERALRTALSDLREQGVTWYRDGGDALGVGLRGKELAAEYGITAVTPVFAIHKKGLYGSIVGRGWETLSDAGALMDEAIAAGADFIKLMLSGIITFRRYGELSCPSPEREEITALIAMAHDRGLSVMAHVNSAEAVLAAAEAGVDSVEHGYFLDERCLDAMADRGTIWVPTLAAVDAFIGREGFDSAVAEETLRRQQEMLTLAIEKDVSVAVGSDSGAAGVPHRTGARRETELLRQGGEEEVFLRGCEKLKDRFQR